MIHQNHSFPGWRRFLAHPKCVHFHVLVGLSETQCTKAKRLFLDPRTPLLSVLEVNSVRFYLQLHLAPVRFKALLCAKDHQLGPSNSKLLLINSSHHRYSVKLSGLNRRES